MTNRFIIVLGMAHSGTTIFTKVLSQCPKIQLIVNGTEAPLLENDYLYKRDPRVLRLLAIPDKFLLLKRPWMEEFSDFFRRYLPNAHYYIMLKTFEAQSKSWSKPKSLVEAELRESKSVQRARYDKCLNLAQNFPLPKRIVHYDYLLTQPKQLFNEINDELGLNHNFNVEEIVNYR